MFRHVSQGGQTLGNNVSATKITLGKHEMFLKLRGNIFASREANFVSATMFPRVGKQGNIRESKMFPQQQCFLACPGL